MVDALQARCLTRIWDPSASQTLLLHAHVIQHAAPVAEPGLPSARLWWTRCRRAACVASGTPQHPNALAACPYDPACCACGRAGLAERQAVGDALQAHRVSGTWNNDPTTKP